jgi:hypothetical protein
MNSKTQVDIKQPTFANAILEYMDYCKADYDVKNEAGIKAHGGEYSIRAFPGRKFIRLVHQITYNEKYGQITAHSFICKTNFVTSDGKFFEQGDILMAASFNEPALNKARGNVLRRAYGKSSWTGTGYL